MLYFLSFFNGRLMGRSKKDHRVTGAGAERLTLTVAYGNEFIAKKKNYFLTDFQDTG